MGQLSWKKLFCSEREHSLQTSLPLFRNAFDADYDRIIGSSSLRRLQDKAQVFPLQENDFIRTRLTHSLEVSAIGRSLGLRVGNTLKEKGIFDEEQKYYLSSLLAVSGLVHDIGNPPFGHYGETIIRNWFKKWFNSFTTETPEKESDKDKAKIDLTDEQKNDFLFYDGNAQTIRILARLQYLNDRYGVAFTYATLATIMKYPIGSSDIKSGKEKFSYFNSEKEVYLKIAGSTGLCKGCRHPATFLLEAADDIAYLFADIEDGTKKGIIPWQKEYSELKKHFANNPELNDRIFKKVDDRCDIAKNNKTPDEELICVQNFRIYGQGYLIENIDKAFEYYYNQIMSCEFNEKELLKEYIPIKEFTQYIRNLCVTYCYRNDEVISLELVGDKVLSFLLDTFIPDVLGQNDDLSGPTIKLNDIRYKKGKLFHLISDNFKYIQCLNSQSECIHYDYELNDYQKIQLIVDFISGMTDSYAVSLHKKLAGISLR